MAAETPSLDTIFCAAVEMASPDDRAAYIAQACGDDQELRGQLGASSSRVPSHIAEGFERAMGRDEWVG